MEQAESGASTRCYQASWAAGEARVLSLASVEAATAPSLASLMPQIRWVTCPSGCTPGACLVDLVHGVDAGDVHAAALDHVNELVNVIVLQASGQGGVQNNQFLPTCHECPDTGRVTPLQACAQGDAVPSQSSHDHRSNAQPTTVHKTGSSADGKPALAPYHLSMFHCSSNCCKQAARTISCAYVCTPRLGLTCRSRLHVLSNNGVFVLLTCLRCTSALWMRYSDSTDFTAARQGGSGGEGKLMKTLVSQGHAFLKAD